MTCTLSGSTVTLASSGGTASAGGSNTQLQLNSSGALGGISGYTSNGTTTITGGASSILDLSAMSVANVKFPAAIFQVAGSNLTSVAGLNMVASSTNATGLAVGVSNPATNQVRHEVTGTVNATSGGTGTDSHTATGVAQLSGGTWSFSTALTNGTTATTQAPGDNTTNVATTAFVQQNSGSNPPFSLIISGNNNTATLGVTSPATLTVPTQSAGDTSTNAANSSFVQANGTVLTTLGDAGSDVCKRLTDVAATTPSSTVSAERDNTGTINDCNNDDWVTANPATMRLAGHTIYRTTNGFTLSDRQKVIGANVGNGGTSVSATTGTSINTMSMFPTAQTGGGGLTTSGTNNIGASTLTIALANSGSVPVLIGDGDQIGIVGDSTRYFVTKCTAGTSPPCVTSTSQFYTISPNATVTLNISPNLASAPGNGTTVHLLQSIVRNGDNTVASGGSVQNTRAQNLFINGDSALAGSGSAIGFLASITCQENCGADQVLVRNAVQGFGIYGAHRSDWYDNGVTINNASFCSTAGSGTIATVPFEIAPFLTTIRGLTIFMDPCTAANLSLGMFHITNNPLSNLGNGSADISNVHGEMCGGNSGCGGGSISGDFFYIDASTGSYDIHNSSGCSTNFACKNFVHVVSGALGMSLNLHDILCNGGTTNLIQTIRKSNFGELEQQMAIRPESR